MPVLIEDAVIIWEHALCYLGRRHPDNIFRRLEQSLRETGNITPTALLSRKRRRIIRTPAKEDDIFAAVGRQAVWLMRYGTRKGTILTTSVLLRQAGERVCFQTTVLLTSTTTRGGELIHTTQYKRTKGLFIFQRS
jgi:hypothetical protein